MSPSAANRSGSAPCLPISCCAASCRRKKTTPSPRSIHEKHENEIVVRPACLVRASRIRLRQQGGGEADRKSCQHYDCDRKEEKPAGGRIGGRQHHLAR